jgi:hypothetical protein
VSKLRAPVRFLVPLVAVLAVAAITTSAATGGSNKPKVLCWNNDYPEPVGNGNAQVKIKPAKCALFKRGESSNAGAVRLVSMQWERWGRNKAKGTGVNVANMGARAKVMVRLSKPVHNCVGKHMFSKAEFTFAGSGKSDFTLWTCPDQ